MEYTFRKSALENEKSYQIQEQELVIKDLKTETVRKLPLHKIKSVHLKYLAKKNMPDAYLCEITTSDNTNITLSSQHYKSLANFENRASTYGPFLLDLHQNLANGNTLFTKGINVLAYWSSMLFFIVMGLTFTAIALAALIPYGLFILLVVVYLTFRLKKHFKLNKPGNYDPLNIPQELLP